MMGDSIFDSVQETVQDLHKAGLVDDVTLKNIESLCVPAVQQYDAVHIAAIRKRRCLPKTP
jgi:putative transcriptional regulator